MKHLVLFCLAALLPGLAGAQFVPPPLPCTVEITEVSVTHVSVHGCTDGSVLFTNNRLTGGTTQLRLTAQRHDGTKWVSLEDQKNRAALEGRDSLMSLVAGQYRLMLSEGELRNAQCSDTAWFEVTQPASDYVIGLEMLAPVSPGCPSRLGYAGNWTRCPGGPRTLILEYSTGGNFMFLGIVGLETSGYFTDAVDVPAVVPPGATLRLRRIQDEAGPTLAFEPLLATCDLKVSWSTEGTRLRYQGQGWTNCSSDPYRRVKVEAHDGSSWSVASLHIYNGTSPFTDSVDLTPGDYRLIVTDSLYCTDTSYFLIEEPAPPVSHWPVTLGSLGDDFVRGLVRDANGNVYASISFLGTIGLQGTSISSVSPNKRAAMLAKFDPYGNLLWHTQIGNGQFNMEPQGVNVDGAGNPYWAGSFVGSVTFADGGAGIPLAASGGHDAYTARFDPATGQCLWATKVGSTGGDYLYALFVSNSGNVYAGGSYGAAFTLNTTSGEATLPHSGGLDGFIVKMNPNGQIIYCTRIGSPGNDEVKSIAYKGGDLVACGYMENNCQFGGTTLVPLPPTSAMPTLGGSRDGWVARINSTGQFIWVKNFGSVFNDEAQSVVVEHNTGNVFVAAQVADAPMTFNGGSMPGYGGNDIVVAGWNFYTQNPAWANRVGSTGGDAPAILAWDGERIALGGYSTGPLNLGPGQTLATNGAQDGVLLHYRSSDGAVTSATSIGGADNDRVLALSVDKDTKKVFAGGRFASNVSFPDLANPAVPRVGVGGLYDGFICRVQPASSSARAGVDKAGLNALAAYPVPTKGLVTIESGTGIDLMTLDGKRLMTAQPVSGVVQLDLSSVPQGLYLARSADGKVARIVRE